MERAKRRAWTQHLRNAIAFATPPLALLALALLRRRAPRVMLLVACAGYFALVWIGERLVYEGLSPLAAAWLANIVYAATAAILMMRRTGTLISRPAQ
jgi:lipopolysaccharide export LptBFGC system permease protein LptF